jgi:hypothetical protein
VLCYLPYDWNALRYTMNCRLDHSQLVCCPANFSLLLYRLMPVPKSSSAVEGEMKSTTASYRELRRLHKAQHLVVPLCKMVSCTCSHKLRHCDFQSKRPARTKIEAFIEFSSISLHTYPVSAAPMGTSNMCEITHSTRLLRATILSPAK